MSRPSPTNPPAASRRFGRAPRLRLTGALLAAALGVTLLATAAPTGAAGAATASRAAGSPAHRPHHHRPHHHKAHHHKPHHHEAPTAAQALKHNRIYRAPAMADVGCAPAAQIPLDTPDDLHAYYKTVLTCLNAAWKAEWPKSLSKHGHRFTRAKLKIHSGDVKSPCGKPLVISYYCGANKTIYMYAPEINQPWAQFPSDYSHGLTRLAATHTIAHEFGHHVQQLSGILPAIRRYTGTTERRAELQASCLGNVFLSAQRSAYPILNDYASYPQYWRYITVANHGSTQSQAYWTDQGYAAAAPGACNTFKAPVSAVS